MGWTSDYLGIAHGTPNWDAQLRNDMSRLQSYLQEGSWTPSYGGGGGATLGNNSSVSGFAVRVGTEIRYFGQFVYGSSAVVGNAAVVGCTAFGANINQTFSFGDGWYKPASGGYPRKLFFVPQSASAFTIMIETSSGLVTLSSVIGSATQSDQILFHLHCTAA